LSYKKNRKMRKLALILTVLTALTGCRKAVVDPLGSCNAASEKWAAAISAYATDFTNSTKCKAAVSAGKELLNACPTLNAADKKAAEASLNDLDC
jgi:hypothetical protein